MRLRAEAKLRYASAPPFGPASTGFRIRGLLQRVVPSRSVVACQKAAVDTVDHRVAEATLIDEEGWCTDGERFDRSESEGLAARHADDRSGATHQRSHLESAEMRCDP